MLQTKQLNFIEVDHQITNYRGKNPILDVPKGTEESRISNKNLLPVFKVHVFTFDCIGNLTFSN